MVFFVLNIAYISKIYELKDKKTFKCDFCDRRFTIKIVLFLKELIFFKKMVLWNLVITVEIGQTYFGGIETNTMIKELKTHKSLLKH